MLNTSFLPGSILLIAALSITGAPGTTGATGTGGGVGSERNAFLAFSQATDIPNAIPSRNITMRMNNTTKIPSVTITGIVKKGEVSFSRDAFADSIIGAARLLIELNEVDVFDVAFFPVFDVLLTTLLIVFVAFFATLEATFVTAFVAFFATLEATFVTVFVAFVTTFVAFFATFATFVTALLATFATVFLKLLAAFTTVFMVFVAKLLTVVNGADINELAFVPLLFFGAVFEFILLDETIDYDN
jgi:hypothetical protein